MFMLLLFSWSNGCNLANYTCTFTKNKVEWLCMKTHA